MIYDIMWEKAKNFWNRVKNTIARAPRTIGAGLNGVTRVVDTTAARIKNTLDTANNTVHKCKDVVVDAWTQWKWYQKLWNIALSPVIFTWTALEWAVRTAVTPTADLLVDGAKTIDTTVKDVARPTFRLFSKKDSFAYEDFKTADVIDKKKNRFSWLQFGKKKWVWADAKTAVKAAAAAATATAATAVAAWTDKLKELKDSFDKKLEEMKKWFSDKINELFAKNKELEGKNTALENENTALKKTNDDLIKKVEAQEKQNAELQKAMASMKSDTKPADKPVELKPEKKEEKPTEVKPEKKEEKPVEAKSEKKDEKSGVKKEEKKEEKKVEWKDGKGADRLSEYIDSDKWKSILNYLNKNHPDMMVKFNKFKDTGHIHLGDSSEEIRVWTKNIEEVPTIILHEWAHALIHDDVEWIEDLIDYVESLNETYGKQLFTLSNNKKYDTKDKKLKEDVCELIALYARDDWSFDRHMKNLQNGKNEKLAQISGSEIEELKDLCDAVISGLNTVKMYNEVPLKKVA